MFFFGNPGDTAEIFKQNALRVKGPKLPDCPLDKMDEKDLRNALTYRYIAAKTALEEGASEEVVSMLVDHYDEAFLSLAGRSERFRSTVRNNLHVYLNGYTRDNITKYKNMVKRFDSAA